MLIEGSGSYHTDIQVENRGCEYFYEYWYSGRNFKGRIVIKSTREWEWIMAIIGLQVENEIDQFVIDQLAEGCIKGQEETGYGRAVYFNA